MNKRINIAFYCLMGLSGILAIIFTNPKASSISGNKIDAMRLKPPVVPTYIQYQPSLDSFFKQAGITPKHGHSYNINGNIFTIGYAPP